jgi:hypothetical protein
VEVHSGPKDEIDPLARIPLPIMHKEKKRFVRIELGAKVIMRTPINQKLKATTIGSKRSTSFVGGGNDNVIS